MTVIGLGVPGDSDGKEFACNVGDLDLISEPRRSKKIPWNSKCQPTPVFLPGEFQDRESWWATQSVGSQRVRHDWATNSNNTMLKTHRLGWLILKTTFLQMLSNSFHELKEIWSIEKVCDLLGVQIWQTVEPRLRSWFILLQNYQQLLLFQRNRSKYRRGKLQSFGLEELGRLASPGDLPDPGIEPRSPALQAYFLLSEPPVKSHKKGKWQSIDLEELRRLLTRSVYKNLWTEAQQN